MSQVFAILRVFRLRQVSTIRQVFLAGAEFLYIFLALKFLYIFLHSYLVCANNLIGTNVLRLLG